MASNRSGSLLSATRTDLGTASRPFDRSSALGTSRSGAANTWWLGSGLHQGGTSGLAASNLNQHFHNNWNWSTNQNHWGFHPWWNSAGHFPWYGNHWNFGWNNAWYNRFYYPYCPWPGYFSADFYPGYTDAIGWGLAAWGLGDLYYQSGYASYCNPYRTALPVVTAGGYGVDYTQPIAAIAAQNAPPDEAAAKQAVAEASAQIDASRDAFKRQDYLSALTLADNAVANLPGDSAIHEYRALVLFALGKYSDAAAVLNSILASGPGWDWSTMVRLFDSQQTYTNHLRKLENYITANPNAADARFVLGYHYLVCGHLSSAATEFESVLRLQPADGVARQLLNLTRNSAKPGEPSAVPDVPRDSGADSRPAAAPLTSDQLVGTWLVDRGKDGIVTLDLTPQGTFTWTFAKPDKTNKLEGHYSINGKGLLVLASGDSQMIGSVSLDDDKHLRFTLAGGPEGDSGMLFAKNP